MTRAHFVKIARKDNPAVKKGESYWWWKFRHGSKHYSKEKPKQSQLTQSEFLSTIYEIEERMENIDTGDLEGFIEQVKEDLETLRDETEEKLDNMPEQLQDGDTGMLLQGRIDAVDEMINEFEAVEVEIDAGEIENEVREDNEQEEDESDEEYNIRIADLVNEAVEEKEQEIVGEIQEITYGGE